MYRFSLGPFQCVVLNVGFFRIGADVMMGPATESERTAAIEKYGIAPEGIAMQMNPLFIDTGHHRVLIDPGTGDDPGLLINALQAAGVAPDSIDSLIVTHGHADHFSGCVDAQGQPAFSNARVFIQRGEWDHWFSIPNPEPHHAQNFQQTLGPIKQQVTFLDGAGEIVPGIEALNTPGHSPFHTAILVGGQMVCVADVLLHPVLIEHPDWYQTFDCWPEQVVETRCRLLRRIVDANLFVSTYHFATPGIGRIVPDGDTYRWQPVETGL